MSNEITRRAFVKSILDDRPANLAVVAGLGSPCWDTAAAGDNPKNMYVWGAMGGAAMIGYGIAQAQKDRRVLVITGDGEMMMGMGAFSTRFWSSTMVATAKPGLSQPTRPGLLILAPLPLHQASKKCGPYRIPMKPRILSRFFLKKQARSSPLQKLNTKSLSLFYHPVAAHS